MQYYRYHYTKLNAKEKRIYDDLARGVEKCAKEVKTIGVSNVKEAMQNVFNAFMWDNPQFYYVNQNLINYTYNSTETVITPGYIFPVSQINAYNRTIQSRANQIITEVIRKAGSSPLKREIALYEYFATHFTYDTPALSSTDPVRKCKAHSMLGVFTDGRSVCEGFAEAFHFLLTLMDIECIRVSGYGKGKSFGRHAWNIVKLNDKYYHVDTTWAINKNDGGKTIWYDYLNISDQVVAIDHSGYSDVPRCKWDDLDYYKTVGAQMNNTQDLKEYIKNCLKYRKSEITFELIKGYGRYGISNPFDGVNLILDATEKAHAELNDCSIRWTTKYSDTRSTYKVIYTYDR